MRWRTRLHRPGIFPHDCLHSYRNRTEALRSLANRDLLRLFAGREELDALALNSSAFNRNTTNNRQHVYRPAP